MILRILLFSVLWTFWAIIGILAFRRFLDRVNPFEKERPLFLTVFLYFCAMFLCLASMALGPFAFLALHKRPGH